jgi:type II secretory pathway predicted ATPase ExeA
MDYSRFGFRARPFRTTPDVDGYYPATGHEAALAELRRGLDDEEGLLLLLGEPGTGKTLLAHRLIETVPEASRTVFLTHGSLRERTELLQAILFDLDLPYREMSEQELRLSLYESCLEHFRLPGRTVILVDEAHLLAPRLLEELRLLGNLEGKEGKAVQVVLIGLPRLMETIEQPGMEVFRQRASVCCKLPPLSVEEAADYLLHQVRQAGGRPDQLLGEDVLDILSHACRGVPRFLNQAAHLAFTLAAEAGAGNVDAEAAVDAVTRLGLDEADEQEQTAPETAIPDAIELAAETLPVAMPLSISPPSIQLAEDSVPPMYVYDGGGVDPGRNDVLAPLPWQSTPQRAG